ncbi:MAG: FixH family protein [Alphaproteobacteria bacterium]
MPVVVAANATMVVFAVGSFTGLTTSEPYTKGLRFNDRIREAEAQRRLGWQLAARIRCVGRTAGRRRDQADGPRRRAPISDAAIAATFSRPVEKGHDFTIALRAGGAGRYSAAAEFPLPGIWDVTYRIERGADTLMARERVQVE